ncbi:MAG: M23 family metallopeptidase [Actinomycetota bacterium]
MVRRASATRCGIVVIVILLTLLGAVPAHAEPAFGTYRWPVRGPVIRGFERPESPYGSGHRGIDIAVAVGTPILAPAPGVVAFAGKIGSSLYVSVDHPDGVRTTFSWLSSVLVRKGDRVSAADTLGTSGEGHAGADIPHLHLGARFGGDYIDPVPLFEPLDLVGLVHLAPLGG